MQITVLFLYFFIITSFFLEAKTQYSAPKKTVLIHPFGDANTIGRYIGESVERSITMNLALEIQSRLESLYPRISVLLSRKIGEVIPPLQNAHFANCLNVDLFISIHFYQETETRPNMYIYHYRDSSYFIKPNNNLMLYPYHQAYLFNQEKTKMCAQKMVLHASQPHYQKQFTIHAAQAFPAKPLLGILPVAIMIEMGIKDEHDRTMYLDPLCNGIVELLKDLS